MAGVGATTGYQAQENAFKAQWRIKREYDILPFVAVRCCRVTIEGTDSVSHTVEVIAATLYEAVAQGLAALRGREWVDGAFHKDTTLLPGHNIIKVAVAEVPVVHQVKAVEFIKWLEQTGGSPRDVNQRQRIRAILRMTISRQS